MEIEVRCALPRYKEEDSPSMLDDAAVAEWLGTLINPTLCFLGGVGGSEKAVLSYNEHDPLQT